MALTEKLMHFANFNITFGKNEEPMLKHFLDIIYPAFVSGYRRGGSEARTRFYMTGVEIKEFVGEYVLVGNFIKDTQYDVYTTFQNGKLMSARSSVPTAPYSRFIIFLKNHRMILVRNESQSPDIRSFQAMVRSMINQYTMNENRNRKIKDKLPHALVNIVDIPLLKDIKTVLKDVKKIKSFQLRFFPLNNDISPLPLFTDVLSGMKSVGSKRAHVNFKSPGSKEGVGDLINKSAGLAATSLEVVNDNGNITRIREDQFTSTTKVLFGGDIKSEDDGYFIEKAKQESVISTTSNENTRLYERVIDGIRRLID
jgi:hypothetical protein